MLNVEYIVKQQLVWYFIKKKRKPTHREKKLLLEFDRICKKTESVLKKDEKFNTVFIINNYYI